MSEVIRVFNAESTSVKFAAHAVEDRKALILLNHGEIDGLRTDPRFVAKDPIDNTLSPHEFAKGQDLDHRAALHYVITWLEQDVAEAKVVGPGHRMVLGGVHYEAPVLIAEDVLTYLDTLVAMEPSHQPCNIAGARALADAFPKLPEVACFDTSFHRTMPQVTQTYALPKDVQDDGARHWGYHGISYDYISRQVPSFAPEARKVVVGHLGGGASMCAMLDGKGVETTMGFGALTGLSMSTRSGDIPQDLLFYLLRTKRFDDKTLEAMLYERSGLLGLSESSGDMKVLQESTDPRAIAAVDAFVYAMTKYVGAYAPCLADWTPWCSPPALARTRQRCGAPCAASSRGAFDEAANASGGPRISTPDSRVSVWVIPTNKELMIAQHTLALVRP